MNHGMYRVMVVGNWIYSMVCDIREYQAESDGIRNYRDSDGIWYRKRWLRSWDKQWYVVVVYEE